MEDILFKYLKGELTPAEQVELDQWLSSSANNKILFDQLNDQKWMSAELEKMEGYDAKERWNELKQRCGIGEVPIRNLFWKRIAVAASILLIIGLGSYFLFFNNKSTDDGQPTIAKQDDIIAPTVTKAMVTLSDGRKISVDSLTSLTQGDVHLSKHDGKIVYSGTSNEIVFNTLTNPRGSKVIDMTLADGSHIWLNAGSSVTYPVAFVGNERKVEIDGEAYFEVAHDANKPFYVSKGEMSVQVLGTHFNVNAYDDEQNIKVTLLEGSVKVNNKVVIKPGQQAVVSNQLQVVNVIDIDKVMAWKNNEFIFDDDNLEDIMRELSRWYNINPIFTGFSATTNYTGRINRTVPVSEVLKLFEKIGYVKFEINGNDIKVIPIK